MNTSTFRQRAFPFTSISYELTGEGLSVTNKNLFKRDSFFIKFEEIGTRRVQSRSIQPRSIMASLLLAFMTILMYVQEHAGANVEKGGWLFYLGICIIVSGMAALSYKRSFFLAQRNHSNRLEFLVNKPTKQAVDAFIHEIISRRRHFLLDKYARFNRLLSYEQQYHNLMWLADLDVLSNDEYLERLDELNQLFSISKELKGFQIHLN